MTSPEPFDEDFEPPTSLPRRLNTEHGNMLGLGARENALFNIALKDKLESHDLLDPDLYRRRCPPQDEISRRRQKKAYHLLEPLLEEQLMVTAVNDALGKEAVMNVMWSKAFVQAQTRPTRRSGPSSQIVKVGSLGPSGGDVPTSSSADKKDDEKPAENPVSTQDSKSALDPCHGMQISNALDVRASTNTPASVSPSTQPDDEEI